MIIITITKEPKLINYNNAPLTKTKLLKNIIKIGHDIEKTKIWRRTEHEGGGGGLKRAC